jgi:hypothetical protein
VTADNWATVTLLAAIMPHRGKPSRSERVELQSPQVDNRESDRHTDLLRQVVRILAHEAAREAFEAELSRQQRGDT